MGRAKKGLGLKKSWFFIFGFSAIDPYLTPSVFPLCTHTHTHTHGCYQGAIAHRRGECVRYMRRSLAPRVEKCRNHPFSNALKLTCRFWRGLNTITNNPIRENQLIQAIIALLILYTRVECVVLLEFRRVWTLHIPLYCLVFDQEIQFV